MGGLTGEWTEFNDSLKINFKDNKNSDKFVSQA